MNSLYSQLNELTTINLRHLHQNHFLVINKDKILQITNKIIEIENNPKFINLLKEIITKFSNKFLVKPSYKNKCYYIEYFTRLNTISSININYNERGLGDWLRNKFSTKNSTTTLETKELDVNFIINELEKILQIKPKKYHIYGTLYDDELLQIIKIINSTYKYISDNREVDTLIDYQWILNELHYTREIYYQSDKNKYNITYSKIINKINNIIEILKKPCRIIPDSYYLDDEEYF